MKFKDIFVLWQREMTMKDVGIRKVSRMTTVQKILESLREYVKETKNPVLPTEDDLSAQLGVSRLTVREAITVLEREGVVSRVQGKGTLINQFVTRLENRIDIGSDIEGCLKQNGYAVRFEVVDFQYRLANAIEASKLGITIEENLLVIKKLLYANDMVAAVYIDRIPEKCIKHKNVEAKDLEPTIFPVVEQICQCAISHDVVEMFPIGADEVLAKDFSVELGKALLGFHVLEYAANSTVLMYNTEYYTDQFISFTLCRSVAYKGW